MFDASSWRSRGEANIGTFDQTVRIVVDLAFLSLIFWVNGEGRWFGLVGMVPLLTGAVRRCPLYSAFGIRT